MNQIYSYNLVVYKKFVDFYSIQLKLTIGTVNLLPVSEPSDDEISNYTQLCVHTNTLQLCVCVHKYTMCTHAELYMDAAGK